VNTSIRNISVTPATVSATSTDRKSIVSAYIPALLLMLILGGVLLYFWGEAWFKTESFFVIFFICLAAGVIITTITSPSYIAALFLTAFILRVLIALGVYYYLYNHYGFRGFEGNDDLHWDTTARLLISGKVPLGAAVGSWFSAGYAFIAAAIYKLAGPGALAPRIFNSMIGGLVVVAGYHLTRELFSEERLARLVAVWLVLLPTLLFWSTAFHKDILISLLMTTGLYACVRMYKRGYDFVAVGLFVFSVIAITLIRTYAGHILLLTGILAAVYRAWREKNVIGSAFRILLVLIIVGGIGLALYEGIGRKEVIDVQAQYVERGASLEKSMEKITSRQQNKGVSALMYSFPLPVRLLVGPFLSLLSPVPPGFAWSRNFSYSVLSVFQPLQLLLFPYIVFGFGIALFRPHDRAPGMILLLPAISITLAASSIYAIGQIPKYRIMIEPLLVIMAVRIYYESTFSRRGIFLLCSLMAGISAVAIYVFLKFIV